MSFLLISDFLLDFCISTDFLSVIFIVRLRRARICRWFFTPILSSLLAGLLGGLGVIVLFWFTFNCEGLDFLDGVSLV